jgi:hypothetical protein
VDDRCVVSGPRTDSLAVTRLDSTRETRDTRRCRISLTAAACPSLRSRRSSARPPRTLRNAVSSRVTLGALRRVFFPLPSCLCVPSP